MAQISVNMREKLAVHFGPYAAMVCLFAGALALLQFWIGVETSIYLDDEGMRMFFAERPANRVGGRIWLPFLQTQIATVHLIGAPYWAYRVIPCFYFMLATASLGLLWLRWAGRSATAAWTAGAVMALFAHQTLVHQLASMMMQEIVGTALFYLFILGLTLEEKPKPGWVLIPAALAMVTRDSYRVMLFVAVMLHLRPALLTALGRRWTLCMVATPLVSQFALLPLGFYIAEGRPPTFPLEWPLGILPGAAPVDLGDSAESLRWGLTESRAIGPFIGVVLAGLLLFFQGRLRAAGSAHSWQNRLLPTVVASLALSYLLIWYVHPWQAQQPATPRMAWPLIEATFLTAAVLARYAAGAQASVRWGATALILGGMLIGIERDVTKWTAPDQRAATEEHERLRAWMEDNGNPSICIQSKNPLSTYNLWSAAVVNSDAWNEWPKPEVLSSDCGAWLIERGTGSRPPDGWTVEAEYEIEGAEYSLWTP